MENQVNPLDKFLNKQDTTSGRAINPTQTSKKPLLILIVLLILCCLLSSLASAGGYVYLRSRDKRESDEDKRQDEPTTTPTPSKAEGTPTPTKAPNAVSGKNAETGEMEWTLVKAESLGSKASGQYGSITSKNGNFIKITYSIKNNSSEEIFPLLPMVLGSTGGGYELDTSSSLIITDLDEVCLFCEIKSGETKTYIGIYDVPSQEKNFKLEVSDGQFLEEAKNKEYIEFKI